MIKEIDDIKLLENFYCNYKIKKTPYSKFAAYEMDNRMIAFIDYSIIYDKAELNYIFVLETFRHHGIASKLMEYMVNDIDNNNCINITLEVRVSNSSAINLYNKYGFKEAAIRDNYYQNEDGILMIRMM